MPGKYSTSGLRALLASREDSEHSQQAVRVTICLITMAVLFVLTVGEPLSHIELICAGVIIAGILLSAGLFLHLLKHPAPNHGRRAVAMVYDYSALGFGMVVAEEVFAFAYCYLLWITVGYGIRYGNAYRAASVILALMTFLIVIVLTDFWMQHLALSVGLWVLLGAIPIYQVGLLHRSSIHNRQVATASEAKTAFLAKLSHELRTPLSAIVLQSEMLAAKRFSIEDHEQAAKTIQTEAMMMLAIVQEVLHVSEIEAGKISIKHDRVEFADTVAQVGRLFRPMAESKSLDFLIHLQLEKPAWMLDELHVRQVIVNVVSNAIKYTEHGQVKLSVVANAEQKQIEIEVEDTGPGMDSYTLGNLFKPFTVGRVPAERGEGSGLGMHITKALVDAMHGTIEVASGKHAGTTTTIVIPATPAPDQDSGREEGDRSTGSFETLVARHAGMVGSKWILVVDDVESNLAIVTRLLQEGRHKIVPLVDVEEALASVEEMTPDLILVDFHMPQMNAPEFIRTLRGLSGAVGQQIPVVVMTADVDPAVTESALAAGATSVVHKPLQVAELFAAVEQGLSYGPGRPPNRRRLRGSPVPG